MSLQSKNTALNIKKPSPAIKKFLDFKEEGPKLMLDYGAGINCRNGEYLRSLGNTVYCYDPFHGSISAHPYNDSIPTLKKPDCSEIFDIAFTAFVLNTIEDDGKVKEILRDCEMYAKESFHIVRNKDLLKLGTEEELKKGIVTKKNTYQRLIDIGKINNSYIKMIETCDYSIRYRYNG
jgi:hypothetical protein